MGGVVECCEGGRRRKKKNVQKPRWGTDRVRVNGEGEKVGGK